MSSLKKMDNVCTSLIQRKHLVLILIMPAKSCEVPERFCTGLYPLKGSQNPNMFFKAMYKAKLDFTEGRVEGGKGVDNLKNPPWQGMKLYPLRGREGYTY